MTVDYNIVNIVLVGSMMKNKQATPYKSSCGYVAYMATSCTSDEAVKMMLGLLSEPLMWVCEDARDYDCCPDPTLSLMEKLDDMIDDALTDYDEAQENHSSDEVLAAMKAAVTESREMKKTATAYLRHIEDELSKSVSELRTIKNEANGSGDVKITLNSLDEWSRKHYQIPILKIPSSIDDERATVENITASTKLARTKLLDQEKAILDAITALACDPLRVPKNVPGHSGIKAKVKERLSSDPLFAGKTVFAKTWQRLREQGDIKDAG